MIGTWKIEPRYWPELLGKAPVPVETDPKTETKPQKPLFHGPLWQTTKMCLQCRKAKVTGKAKFCALCTKARNARAARKSYKKLNPHKLVTGPLQYEALTTDQN